MSQIIKPGTGGGGGSGIIQTIAGDIGSITGANVTIFANNATNNSGASVLFNNAGTVSTLQLSDASANIFLGDLSGNLSLTGHGNVGVGSESLGALTSGSQNVAIGLGSLDQLLTGNLNVAIGEGSGTLCTGSESNNIFIGNRGGTGDNNVIRIGSTTSGGPTQNFQAGIVGNQPAQADHVIIDPGTGQLGSYPNVFFEANLSSPQTTTASSTTDVVIFDQLIVNTGGGYDNTTGIFTSPQAGIYSFSTVVSYSNLTTLVGNTMLILAYTGSQQSLRLVNQSNVIVTPGSGGSVILSASWNVFLNAGQTMFVQPFVDGTGSYLIFGQLSSSVAFNFTSQFTGILISSV